MTFEEWFTNRRKTITFFMAGLCEQLAKEAWEAAFLDGYERGRAAFCEAVALEREACAKIAEAKAAEWQDRLGVDIAPESVQLGGIAAAQIAAAIRRAR